MLASSPGGSAASDWTRDYSGHIHCAEQSYLDLSRTGNLEAVQLLLGHTKIESTVWYLGIEVDDALAIAEQVDV
jgi:site-specific recombinase XerC